MKKTAALLLTFSGRGPRNCCGIRGPCTLHPQRLGGGLAQTTHGFPPYRTRRKPEPQLPQRSATRSCHRGPLPTATRRVSSGPVPGCSEIGSLVIDHVSNSLYHFLLRMAGLSFHQPEKFDRRRADEKANDLRGKEILKNWLPRWLT